MVSLADESFPEPLLSFDENREDATSYATTSGSKTSSRNFSSSTVSSKSCKESIHKLFEKPINQSTSTPTYNKREVMKKKSQSYQDLHLPSVRLRYSNVQSKVKLYIDSMKSSGSSVSHSKRTPLLRHKSMPETYQNLLEEEGLSPNALKRKFISLHADNEELSKVNTVLQRDLEAVKIEKHLLAKKIDEMRMTISELKLRGGIASRTHHTSRDVVFREVQAAATQTYNLEERTGYELSATVSLQSLEVDEIGNEANPQNSSRTSVKKTKKPVSGIGRKFKKFFSCVH